MTTDHIVARFIVPVSILIALFVATYTGGAYWSW